MIKIRNIAQPYCNVLKHLHLSLFLMVLMWLLIVTVSLCCRKDTLKKRLTRDFPQLVFHNPTLRNVCELVFVPVSLQDCVALTLVVVPIVQIQKTQRKKGLMTPLRERERDSGSHIVSGCPLCLSVLHRYWYKSAIRRTTNLQLKRHNPIYIKLKYKVKIICNRSL